MCQRFDKLVGNSIVAKRKEKTIVNFLEIFDDRVTDNDLWNLGTEVFVAMIVGMLLAVSIYVVVTL